jgi:hypothetical protein
LCSRNKSIAVEKALRELTSPVHNQFVREILKNKLIDLQKDDNSEFQIEKQSGPFDEENLVQPRGRTEDRPGDKPGLLRRQAQQSRFFSL